MKTYIFILGNQIHSHSLDHNPRGFYENELKEELQKNNNSDIEKLCIEDEIEKYNLGKSADNIYGLDEPEYNYKIWNENYNNRFINGFNIPMKTASSREYRKQLENTLKQYINHIQRPPFVYEKNLLRDVKKIIDSILVTLDLLINGENDDADNKMLELLELFHNDPFLISDLDSSYSFRALAPFLDITGDRYKNLYSKMKNTELTFFRARTKNKDDNNISISDQEHILHLPYDLRDNASNMRFSIAGQPALYLSTTTFACSKECDWKKDSQDLYAAVFIPNKKGKKLKILNLTTSAALINGITNYWDVYKKNERLIKLQTSLLKIFPIVIATSFSVEKEEAEEEKYQYLISQALMRVAKQDGIDGIAYFSMKGDSEFEFPQGVNLAIPASDISDSMQYSEKCKGFEISKPILYCGQKGTKAQSYINQVYQKNVCGVNNFFASQIKINGKMQFYGETCYGQFDDFLTSLLRGEN